MLLAEERGTAFTTFILPILLQLPSAYFLLPQAKKQRENFWVRNITIGMMIPGACQLLVIFLGGIVMEALEMQAEKDAHNEFCTWMRHAKDTTPSLYPDLVDKLGDPDAQHWRNWDIFGSTFYCFTLMTTIGYGTFAPATSAGKVFSCFFALFAIPFAAWSYSNLGNSVVCGLFHPCIRRRMERVRQSWPAFQATNVDGSDGVSREEILAALDQTSIWAGRTTIVEYVNESMSQDKQMSAAQYDVLVHRIMDLVHEQMLLMLSFTCMLAYIIICSITYPLAADAESEDGFYWCIITFTTVGLGDKTWPLANAVSLHGGFNWPFFLFISVGLALLAVVVGNVLSISKNIWSLTTVAISVGSKTLGNISFRQDSIPPQSLKTQASETDETDARSLESI